MIRARLLFTAALLALPLAPAFAQDVIRVTEPRALTTLVLTLDEPFATREAIRALKLKPVDGSRVAIRKQRWF